MGNFEKDVTKTLGWVINEIKCLKKRCCVPPATPVTFNQNNKVRLINLGTFSSSTVSIDAFLDTYSLTVLEDEIVILDATIEGLLESRFFHLGKGVYPTVGTLVNWTDLPLNYKDASTFVLGELQDLQDQIDALSGGTGLQNTLDVQNFAYGQNLRLKNASNSDSEIELNVDDSSEAYLRVTDYNVDKAKNMYVKADHILYSDIEGRECIINFGNISLASLLPVVEPTVVLSVGQNSGFIATQEETQILLDLKADLVGGLVPSAQLPPAVDEILEYTDSSFFPITGVSNKYYLDLTTNKTYRWSGSVYVPINEGIALGETSSTAYRGDRGKAAYDHSLVITGNPHNVTKSDVGLSLIENIDYLPLAGGTMESGANISFANGSYIGEGSVNEGTGGNNGVELTCSIGYKWKWEAGEIYMRDQLGYITKKENSIIIPLPTDDISKGYIVGTTWVMANEVTYLCTDATVGSAIWTFMSAPSYVSVAPNQIAYGDPNAYDSNAVKGDSNFTKSNSNIRIGSDSTSAVVLGVDFLETGDCGVYSAASDEIIANYNSTLDVYKYGNGVITIDAGIALVQGEPIANTTDTVEKGVNNGTTTVLTSTTLDSTYPSATTGFKVYCTSIIAGKMIYEKTPTGWVGYAIIIP